MASKMPPPGSDGPGLAIMIGVPKGDRGGKMAPPGSDAPQEGGKASPEEAGVRREDEKCIDCENYDPQTGDCSKVAGTFSPQDTCGLYFHAVDDDESNEQPDADDSGAPPMDSNGGPQQ